MRNRGVFLLGLFAVLLMNVLPLRAQTGNIPLLTCAGLPCVDVAAGEQHLRLLIDTGNANSVLDRGVAERLGLHLEPLKQYPKYAMATLPALHVGKIDLGAQQVLVVDLGKSIKDGTMPPAVGSLAYTALKGRVLTMNYRDHRLTLSPVLTAETRCSSACGEIAYPTFGKHGPPIVTSTGFRVNGEPVTMQIDTLYTGTMLIYPTSVDRLGLQAQAASTQQRNFPFTDGGVPMMEGTAARESFGNRTLLRHAALYFATPKVHLPDGMFDGTVGDALFRGHVLIFDFHANRFSMS